MTNGTTRFQYEKTELRCPRCSAPMRARRPMERQLSPITNGTVHIIGARIDRLECEKCDFRMRV